MRSIVVGVADCRINGSAAEQLVTYALGSCMAVAAYDPALKLGGLLHFMLPDSTMDPPRGLTDPWMFADTAVPLLFRTLSERGAAKARLEVHVAGGARMLNDDALFKIATRNHNALRKSLSSAGVLVKSEAVGGSTVRAVGLETASGRFWVRESSPGAPWQ